MRRTVAFGVVLLSLFGTSCSLVRDASCLTTVQMQESVEDFSESVRTRKWAEQAWKHVLENHPEAPDSEDYAEGFKDGYVNCFYRGANGEPPRLPPQRYRQASYRTPEGKQAIEDWFAGYRNGAWVARESGSRQGSAASAALPTPGPVSPLPTPVPDVAASPPIRAEVALMPEGEPPGQRGPSARLLSVAPLPEGPLIFVEFHRDVSHGLENRHQDP
jgi:hypothetical protein